MSKSGFGRGEAVGWAAAIGAVSIWASWAVATRWLLGSATLDAIDMIAVRFLTAAALMLPHALRHGLPLRRLPPLSLAAVVGGSGFAFSLCNTGGLVFAPAGHAGAMTAPLSAVFTGLLAHLVLRERLGRRSLSGLGLILAGVATLVGATLAGHDRRVFLGHALFAGAGFLFACYTIAIRRARLGSLDAVALSVIGSAVVYVPVYLLLVGPRFLDAPAAELFLQGALHGGLAATLSVILFSIGVARLGAARAASPAALNPALTALLAIPVLGEVPSLIEIPGFAALTAGVWLASGARLRGGPRLEPPGKGA
jgi:drug/metabolite transporter (DMT)-like permease